MNRRNFLKGLAGLAAVAASGKALALVSQTERERLVSLMRDSGVIEGQTFILEDSGPVVFQGVHRLIVRNCRFIWHVPATGCLVELRDCKDLLIEGCFFDGGCLNTSI